jgi:hypothetical protein
LAVSNIEPILIKIFILVYAFIEVIFIFIPTLRAIYRTREFTEAVAITFTLCIPNEELTTIILNSSSTFLDSGL